jgi:hypothetical protein
MEATKKGLLSFVQQMGMTVLSELLATEAAQIAGPKGKHIEGRGEFQDSCRNRACLVYEPATSLAWLFVGLSVTVPTTLQLRVPPDHRVGCFLRATS